MNYIDENDLKLQILGEVIILCTTRIEVKSFMLELNVANIRDEN